VDVISDAKEGVDRREKPRRTNAKLHVDVNERLQVNREFIQVRNVQSSKLRTTAHAAHCSSGELGCGRGQIASLF